MWDARGRPKIVETRVILDSMVSGCASCANSLRLLRNAKKRNAKGSSEAAEAVASHPRNHVKSRNRPLSGNLTVKGLQHGGLVILTSVVSF